jgi:hypothetical protein
MNEGVEMQQRENEVPYANKGIEVRPHEKKKRKRTSRANPHPTMKHVLGVSYAEEADLDYEMGLEALDKYKRTALTYHLRQAGISFKMAADRYDHSEHLRGNTLERYIKEERER